MFPSPNFRENPARAVFVTGEIGEPLVHRLTSDICGLRGVGSDPITVYINSRGGSTAHAEQIRALLTTPNQEGQVCRMITVATNRADSAAADLLALGDYAIAYPNAAIHCHGTRLSADEITKEKAEYLAASLKETNEDFALRLARRTFARMAFHFGNLRPDFAKMRGDDAKSGVNAPSMSTDLGCFARVIFGKLSQRSSDLPRQAFERHAALSEMSQFVFSKLSEIKNGQPLAATEAEMLKHILDFELSRRDLTKWNLSGGGMNDLVGDFGSLADYIFGPHRAALENQINPLGPLFLDPADIKEYDDRRKNDPAQAEEWLRARVCPIIEPLWYFVVSLCRLLQQGEYSLSAVDAYWLGIVDEVIGEKLPTLRLVAENPEA